MSTPVESSNNTQLSVISAQLVARFNARSAESLSFTTHRHAVLAVMGTAFGAALYASFNMQMGFALALSVPVILALAAVFWSHYDRKIGANGAYIKTIESRMKAIDGMTGWHEQRGNAKSILKVGMYITFVVMDCISLMVGTGLFVMAQPKVWLNITLFSILAPLAVIALVASLFLIKGARKNHVHLPSEEKAIEELAQLCGVSVEELRQQIAAARQVAEDVAKKAREAELRELLGLPEVTG